MKQLTKNMYTKNILAAVIATSSTYSFAAFNSTGTEFSLAPQNYHVWNESLKPVDLVNNILCFTGQLKASEFINKGPYLVLADEAACFKEDNSNSESAQSSGASNTPSYTKIIVNATRESVDDPLLVKVWIPAMGQGDDVQSIKFKSFISKGASAENPFGSFTFNYNFYETIDSNIALGGGEIKTIEIPGKIGFTFYEKESEDQNRVSEKGASVVMSSDRSTGIAFTFNHQTDGQQNQGDYYGLAFNGNNVLTQKADTYARLPFNSQDANTGTEACLSRTSFDESVWRYNLFDAGSGASVKLNSGISFKYDSNNDNVPDSYGQISYWGMWTEHGDNLSDGATIVAQNPDNNNLPSASYTISKAPGRLIKNTVEQVAVSNIRGIQFNYFSPDAMQSNFQSWLVQYLTVAHDGVSSNGFYKVAGSSYNDGGPSVTTPQQPIAITLGYHETLNMNSEQLGGPVKYQSGDSFITFAKQEFINGSETGTGQLLASGGLTLYCVDRCPVGTLGSAQLATWNTPYSDPIQTLDNAKVFTFSTSGVNPLTLVRQSNSEPIRYAGGLTAEGLSANNSPYSWGIRSGALVTADVLASLTSPWDIYNPTKVTVFYEWETGLNSFNQMVTVKDTNGVIQTFDKPIQFTYTHTNANDRSGNAGIYNGKVTLLSYGGNGQLGGIPSAQDSEGRYNALFTIADGTLLGPENKYVIKAQEIEGTMKSTAGQCTNLQLSAPLKPVPTATTSHASDIGAMPSVTGSPKVIAGVIQATAP
ncbi:MAG: hypothetical protein EOO53_02330 [Gammaproteobacteria bacterium]|nr:MAG: hypothetical protein EOO53_02330 [Gammaproteobacteria bacterium]